jgi:hypothetical protein
MVALWETVLAAFILLNVIFAGVGELAGPSMACLQGIGHLLQLGAPLSCLPRVLPLKDGSIACNLLGAGVDLLRSFGKQSSLCRSVWGTFARRYPPGAAGATHPVCSSSADALVHCQGLCLSVFTACI